MTVSELISKCADPLTVRIEGVAGCWSGSLELLALKKEYGNRNVERIMPIYYGIVLRLEKEVAEP